MAPPLKAADSPKHPGTLPIGYGAGGGDPFIFIVSEEVSFETSFLKFFVSERYVNMDYIKQCSAFDLGQKRKKYDLNDGQWGTLLATVTARR